MRPAMLLVVLVSLADFLSAPYAQAAPLQVDWITQYCNETIQTTDLSTEPRMLRNISNSLMSSAPSVLNGSIYLQRRSDENLCPSLTGIAETSQQWLRPDRVSISGPAVVVAAVREDFYPGAGALLTSLGWESLGETITLNYVSGIAHLALYAGLVDAGPVQISGAGVNQLRSGGDIATNSDYFFFQNSTAFSPATLAGLQSVSVPEPGSVVLAACGFLSLIARRRRRASVVNTERTDPIAQPASV